MRLLFCSFVWLSVSATLARRKTIPRLGQRYSELILGRRDLNPRPLAPEASALARLSYSPTNTSRGDFHPSKPRDAAFHARSGREHTRKWSGQVILSHRPLAPKASALHLSYAPTKTGGSPRNRTGKWSDTSRLLCLLKPASHEPKLEPAKGLEPPTVDLQNRRAAIAPHRLTKKMVEAERFELSSAGCGPAALPIELSPHERIQLSYRNGLSRSYRVGVAAAGVAGRCAGEVKYRMTSPV